MKKCSWKRARSDDQKAQRIHEIVSATEKLYAKKGYTNITFVDIAKEAGFTRSNLYKYFQSKEEIFLEFLKSDLRKWKSDLGKSFKEPTNILQNEFIDIWCDTLIHNKRLIELMSLLYLHLEKEASYDALLNFKKEFSIDFFEIVKILDNKVKGLTSDRIITFLNLQTALTIGLYQACDLSENQSKILEQLEFSRYKINFNKKLKEGLTYILNGIVNS